MKSRNTEPTALERRRRPSGSGGMTGPKVCEIWPHADALREGLRQAES